MSNDIILDQAGCKVKISGDNIYCEHPHGASTTNWQITLLTDQLIYTQKKERKVLQVASIKEFQYEMDELGSKSGVSIAALVYIVTHTDDDPKRLFILGTHERFTYSNQTQAYAICTEVLQHIGQRYQIPFIYKLSIDTKEKNNRIGWIILFFILFWIFLYYRLKLG